MPQVTCALVYFMYLEHVFGFSSSRLLVFVFLVPWSPLSVTGLDFLHGSVWHPQSSRQGDEIRWR